LVLAVITAVASKSETTMGAFMEAPDDVTGVCQIDYGLAAIASKNGYDPLPRHLTCTRRYRHYSADAVGRQTVSAR
jgi:hypothetical protein